MPDERNRLEKLESRIKELEKKVRELPKKEQIISDLKERLYKYETEIGSDKGNFKLKKNFVIKNRKGIIKKDEFIPGGVDPDEDNVALFYFNNRGTRRLNHIFIGNAGTEGYYNNSVLSGSVVVKDDVSVNKANNGQIQFFMVRDEDIKEDGTLQPLVIAHISVTREELLSGEKGNSPSLNATGRHGKARLAHFDVKDGGRGNILWVTKDGIEWTQGDAMKQLIDINDYDFRGPLTKLHIGEEPPKDSDGNPIQDPSIIWLDTS